MYWSNQVWEMEDIARCRSCIILFVIPIFYLIKCYRTIQVGILSGMSVPHLSDRLLKLVSDRLLNFVIDSLIQIKILNKPAN